MQHTPIRFVVGSGKDRITVPRANGGKDLHVQRRALKLHLGLLRAPATAQQREGR
jgi:hypothetical protein